MFSNDMFCSRLRQLRQSMNLNTIQLGKDLGVTKQTISHWENGDRLPAITAFIALADYFDVSIDYLVGRSDDPARR